MSIVIDSVPKIWDAYSLIWVVWILERGKRRIRFSYKMELSMHECIELVVIEIWVVIKILESINEWIRIKHLTGILHADKKEGDEKENKDNPDDREVFVFAIKLGEIANKVGKESEPA